MGIWKIFIWENVDEVSEQWHCDGGVVVVAESEDRARKIANEKDGCNIRPDEKFTAVYQLSADVEEAVYIFPDAGCC